MSNELYTPFISSGLNVSQSSISEDFISKPPRPSGVGSDKLSSNSFNVWAVIMAALTFIVIISWFETFRLLIQIYFIQNDILRTQCIAYFVYTACLTLIAILLFYIIYRINESK